jgi:hypothetical protein
LSGDAKREERGAKNKAQDFLTHGLSIKNRLGNERFSPTSSALMIASFAAGAYPTTRSWVKQKSKFKTDSGRCLQIKTWIDIFAQAGIVSGPNSESDLLVIVGAT